MRSISSMIDEMRDQHDAVLRLAGRVRLANRRLTGETGENQKQSPGGSIGGADTPTDAPLLVELSRVIERFSSALIDLSDEVTCLERVSETSPALSAVESVGGFGGAKAAFRAAFGDGKEYSPAGQIYRP